MHLPDASNFTPAPAGAHRAVCISFIDVGTQKDMFGGKVNIRHQVRLGWELCDELKDDGKPFVIVKTFTWSMNEKSNLRKSLESWRGRPFEKADFGANGFDTKKLLGVPCLLTVVHTEKGSAKVASISPLPKGMEKPQGAVNKLTYLALEPGSFDKAVFESLSDVTKEQIKLSPEYQAVVHGKRPSVSEYDGSQDYDDEIPF
jgi:hypothetical protein